MKKTLLITLLIGIVISVKAQDETINGNLIIDGTASAKGANSIYSTENGKTNFRFTINAQDADNSFIYNYNPASATFHTINIGGTHSLSSGLTVAGNGNIGVGTSYLGNAIMTINGNSYNNLRLENDTPNKEASMRFRSKSSSGGTLHSDISLYATGNNQGYLGFKVPHNNSVNSGYDMIINHSGNVGIGTTNPNGWKLAVNGQIRAKEIKVETGWSDFVFYDDYKLPTLLEVENHIKENGHLKDIPSAKEVEENGIFLGEMDSKLLQKIEELTLYTIQQEKKIEQQTKEIEKLKSLNEQFLELQKRLEKLESE